MPADIAKPAGPDEDDAAARIRDERNRQRFRFETTKREGRVMKRLWVPVAAALFAVSAFGSATAQTYPAHPITLIAPYSAGSGIDIMARMLAESMGKQLGRPIIVENRPGAGGNIGSDVAAKSPPDGYTLLISSNSIAVAPALYKGLAFDPVRSFAHVARIATGSMALVVNPKALPVRNLNELINTAKQQPGKLNYSSAGNGTPHHLDMELLKQRLNLDIVHVPYTGATGALNDLLAGHVQIGMFPVNVVVPSVKSQNLRVLAVSSKGRASLDPDAQSFEELGLSDLDLDVYYLLSAPANTPQAIVTRLNEAMRGALEEPDLRARFATLGLEPSPGSPAEITGQIEKDVPRWSKFIADAGIQVESMR
ncbi:tripartite tricarboxylate transporter substrate binding protein [Roseiarcaceae bacterium H3SJ34-1]|uniref:Bug family tripartite tricarboxylate transporter substrate binding protein n=1 Tax=Terripilifer ovatus TaxID=3032367 RepID=UPI003AB967A8|nr:tripartite tricarboxylate transporter substrate binding protein [Roseiarcaceae bacterium H3SJ34-1]